MNVSMAFASRNAFLFLFFIIAIGIFGFALLNIAFLAVAAAKGTDFGFFESHIFWFIHDQVPIGSVWSIASTVVLTFFGFFAFVVLRVFFKKIGQAEVFFFSLFIFSFLLDSLRLVIINLKYFSFSPLFGIFLSRTVLGSRIFGLLCLFLSGLYALDFQYQKFEIIISVSAFVSFLFAFILPFDPQVFMTNGLYKLSNEQDFFILYLVIVVFISINSITTIARGRTLLIPVGIWGLLVSTEILFFSLSPLSFGIGTILLLGSFIVTFKGFDTLFDFG
jgi:hypothetical protein